VKYIIQASLAFQRVLTMMKITPVIIYLIVIYNFIPYKPLKPKAKKIPYSGKGEGYILE